MNAVRSAAQSQSLERAFHSAFESELKEALSDLPFPNGACVLDAPCGDGFYTELLARRVGVIGRVVAADRSFDLLAQTRRRCSGLSGAAAVDCIEADVYRSPWAAGAFDGVWCAESFITLDDPVAALRELRRAVRPGGFIAVLESDELHHVWLHWPVDLEAAIQAAVRDFSRQTYGRDAKLCPARVLHRQLKQAGFGLERRTTIAADRIAPFDVDSRRFLRLHLDFLSKITQGRLTGGLHRKFEALLDEDADASWLGGANGEFTCLMQLFLARPR